MNIVFYLGIIGSVLLVLGSAWGESVPFLKTALSLKNWFLTLGTFVMFFYALGNYYYGGEIFFVFLEIISTLAALFLLFGMKNNIALPVIGASGGVLVIASFILLKDIYTLLFILGLVLTSFGYMYTENPLKRNLYFTIGSLMLASFSYISASWIFFFLNISFALFSGWYLSLSLIKRKTPAQ